MRTISGKKYYLLHYFDFTHAGPFLLISLLGLAAVLAVILIAARIQVAREKDALVSRIRSSDADTAEIRISKKRMRRHPFVLIESFYEMVFSSTSVLLFLSLYYIIDERIPQASVIWKKYQDPILLLFIVASVFLTSYFDRILVRLTHLPEEQKAAVRLVSSFYIVLILLYIRFIYKDNNYNALILYFCTLAVGRFLYFDFTVTAFADTLRNAASALPMLLLMGVYSGIVCWYGFHVGFLLKSNGVIVSTLIAHFFMDLSIIILDKTRLLHLFLPDE